MWPARLTCKILFACLFILAGSAHFRFPGLYARIMPPVLPQPRLLVYLSGAFEIALGLLLLVPAGTKIASWGLIALLVAVFPANVYMAIHPELFPRIPVWSLWVRLPLQGLLVAWAYYYARG